jgi:hypothetical protein
MWPALTTLPGQRLHYFWPKQNSDSSERRNLPVRVRGNAFTEK